MPFRVSIYERLLPMSRDRQKYAVFRLFQPYLSKLSLISPFAHDVFVRELTPQFACFFGLDTVIFL